MVGRGVRALRSVRLTIILLAYFAVSIAAVTFLPAGRAEGFYTSPWFYVPVALFLLNLTACIISRFARSIRTRAVGKLGADVAHVGFLLLAVGGLLSFYGRHMEQVTLVPGDRVTLRGGYEIELERVSAEYYRDGRPKAYGSVLRVRSPEGAERVMRVGANTPGHVGPFRVHQESFTRVSTPSGTKNAARFLFAMDPGYGPVVVGAVMVVVGMIASFAMRAREVSGR